MHRISGKLSKLHLYLAIGVAGLGLTFSGLLAMNESSDAVAIPEALAYSPESVETAKQLWIGVDTPEALAQCYTNVLRDAGVLAEPIETNADLVEAHESMTDEQQQAMDDCRKIAEPTVRQNVLNLAKVSNL